VPIFSDEFTGPAGARPDATKWEAMDWCDNWGSLSCNTNRTANVALDGYGDLRILARKEAYTDAYGNHGGYTAARLHTGRRFRFFTGWIQARIKIPAGTGLWPSFWTAGSGSWPATGEIDVMEVLGHTPTKSYCSIHAVDTAARQIHNTQSYTAPTSLAAGYHIYTAHWTATQISFAVDGRPCGNPIALTGLRPFTAQDVMIGLAVGGDWPGPPDATTRFPAAMYVDWIRAYGP
jgi:beta-glucanase (GH16 family)